MVEGQWYVKRVWEHDGQEMSTVLHKVDTEAEAIQLRDGLRQWYQSTQYIYEAYDPTKFHWPGINSVEIQDERKLDG